MKLNCNALVVWAVFLCATGVTEVTFADDGPEKKSGFEFTIVTQLDASSVKNQAKTGTCWSFATNSFLESELLILSFESDFFRLQK